MIERLYLRLLDFLIGSRPLIANVSVILPPGETRLDRPLTLIRSSIRAARQFE